VAPARADFAGVEEPPRARAAEPAQRRRVAPGVRPVQVDAREVAQADRDVAAGRLRRRYQRLAERALAAAARERERRADRRELAGAFRRELAHFVTALRQPLRELGRRPLRAASIGLPPVDQEPDAHAEENTVPGSFSRAGRRREVPRRARPARENEPGTVFSSACASGSTCRRCTGPIRGASCGSRRGSSQRSRTRGAPRDRAARSAAGTGRQDCARGAPSSSRAGRASSASPASTRPSRRSRAAARAPACRTIHELPWRHGAAEGADLRHRAWAAFGPLRAEAVLTATEFVARDLRRRLLPGASKVRVVPWGVDPAFADEPAADVVDEVVLGRYRLPQGAWAIALGAVRPKKNLAAFLNGLAEHARRGAEPVRLVVTGGDTPQLRRDLGLAGRLGLSRFVTTLDEIADEDLPSVLRLASVVPVLSRSEGFGLPVLEAMACGTPRARAARLGAGGGRGPRRPGRRPGRIPSRSPTASRARWRSARSAAPRSPRARASSPGTAAPLRSRRSGARSRERAARRSGSARPRARDAPRPADGRRAAAQRGAPAARGRDPRVRAAARWRSSRASSPPRSPSSLRSSASPRTRSRTPSSRAPRRKARPRAACSRAPPASRSTSSTPRTCPRRASGGRATR
jgi:glycosyltransferase involved in cell wall biosynthesis